MDSEQRRDFMITRRRATADIGLEVDKKPRRPRSTIENFGHPIRSVDRVTPSGRRIQTSNNLTTENPPDLSHFGTATGVPLNTTKDELQSSEPTRGFIIKKNRGRSPSPDSKNVKFSQVNPELMTEKVKKRSLMDALLKSFVRGKETTGKTFFQKTKKSIADGNFDIEPELQKFHKKRNQFSTSEVQHTADTEKFKSKEMVLLMIEYRLKDIYSFVKTNIDKQVA
jgi:hypothetical protein